MVPIDRTRLATVLACVALLAVVASVAVPLWPGHRPPITPSRAEKRPQAVLVASPGYGDPDPAESPGVQAPSSEAAPDGDVQVSSRPPAEQGEAQSAPLEPSVAPVLPPLEEEEVRQVSPEEAEANSILDELVRKHPILKGTRLQFGPTTKNVQAEAYYETGLIVIRPDHTRSLRVILNHEIWHVIDWREDGRIDWGERLPPAYPEPE